jgi:hypothetical protein
LSHFEYGVVSIEGDNLELFDHLSASEIWPDKRGGFWWSDLTRGELFSKRKCNIQNETTDQNNISVITYTRWFSPDTPVSSTNKTDHHVKHHTPYAFCKP